VCARAHVPAGLCATVAAVSQVMEWKEQYGGRINEQLKRMGSSLDWSRAVFTMDAGHSHAVNEAFFTLFERGLIYRKNRIVNWCPHLQTVISDIEVDVMQVCLRNARTAAAAGPAGVSVSLLLSLRCAARWSYRYRHSRAQGHRGVWCSGVVCVPLRPRRRPHRSQHDAVGDDAWRCRRGRSPRRPSLPPLDR
jgi:hypothetical protein